MHVYEELHIGLSAHLSSLKCLNQINVLFLFFVVMSGLLV